MPFQNKEQAKMANIFIILLLTWSVSGQKHENKIIHTNAIMMHPEDVNDVRQESIQKLMTASKFRSTELSKDLNNISAKPCRRRFFSQNLPQNDVASPIIHSYSMEPVFANKREMQNIWVPQSLKNELPDLYDNDKKEMMEIPEPLNNKNIDNKDFAVKIEDRKENIQQVKNPVLFTNDFNLDVKNKEVCDDKKEDIFETNEPWTRRLLNNDKSFSIPKLSTKKLNDEVIFKRADNLLLDDSSDKMQEIINKQYQTDTIAPSGPMSPDSKLINANQDKIVCFACSSLNNPRCLEPGQHTTVKYCKKGQDVCVSKIYDFQNTEIVVRDCAPSCLVSTIPGFPSNPKSCSTCKTDLCNAAYAVNSHKFLLIICIVSVFKYICN